jgi:hypothetical protein
VYFVEQTLHRYWFFALLITRHRNTGLNKPHVLHTNVPFIPKSGKAIVRDAVAPTTDGARVDSEAPASEGVPGMEKVAEAGKGEVARDNKDGVAGCNTGVGARATPSDDVSVPSAGSCSPSLTELATPSCAAGMSSFCVAVSVRTSVAGIGVARAGVASSTLMVSVFMPNEGFSPCN